MKYAVTDIGANTVKISIYSVENGAAKHIISQSTSVGLAGYAADGVLSDTGISELAAVVSDYEKLAETVSADGAFYIATASLRNISNGEYAVSEVFRRTGIRISVISGGARGGAWLYRFPFGGTRRVQMVPGRRYFCRYGGRKYRACFGRRRQRRFQNKPAVRCSEAV